MARDSALTCGCGGYARSCRRLPVRFAPKGASGANAPPASLLPLSLGGCTVVHPYKRLITIEISTFVVMLSRFLLGLLPRSSRHGDVHPARSAQSRVAAHLFGSHGQERA